MRVESGFFAKRCDLLLEAVNKPDPKVSGLFITLPRRCEELHEGVKNRETPSRSPTARGSTHPLLTTIRHLLLLSFAEELISLRISKHAVITRDSDAPHFKNPPPGGFLTAMPGVPFLTATRHHAAESLLSSEAAVTSGSFFSFFFRGTLGGALSIASGSSTASMP